MNTKQTTTGLAFLAALVLVGALSYFAGTHKPAKSQAEVATIAKAPMESPAAKPAAAATPAVKNASGINYVFDEAAPDRSNVRRVSSYADVMERVLPAVVSVTTYATRPTRGGRGRGQQPVDPYNQTPNNPPGTGRGRGGSQPFGVGSGSIISPDGYIITNHHVVTNEGMIAVDSILVQLNDGREFVAKLIGSDEATDIALIKIEGKDLPTITLADSDKLKVGDLVFAVGDPMGIGATVTQGIVSATGRSDLGLLGEKGFENFIQTDAAINSGNSGGPLIDTQGRQVGLNSAILALSRTGGNIGIGFSVPTSLARHIIESLMTNNGKVKRALLGVGGMSLTHELAVEKGLQNSHGALVMEVNPASPAEKAGLKEGDVVTQLDDVEVDTYEKLRFLVARAEPGAQVKLKVWREGKTQVFAVKLGDRDDLEALAAARPTPRVPQPEGPILGTPAPVAPVEPSPVATADQPLPGVILDNVSEKLRTQYKLPKDVKGVMITVVGADSVFAKQFEPGSVITEINHRPVPNVADVAALLKHDAVNVFVIYDDTDGHFKYMSILLP